MNETTISNADQCANVRLPLKRSISSAYASAGGSFCWELADAALQFHDFNCVGCVHRKPVSLPNLSARGAGIG